MKDKIGYDWNAVPEAFGEAIIALGFLVLAGVVISWFCWVFGIAPFFNTVFIRFEASLLAVLAVVFAGVAAGARYAAVQTAKRRVIDRLAGKPTTAEERRKFYEESTW